MQIDPSTAIRAATPAGQIAEARALFPGTAKCIYLDVAARGLLPGATRAIVDAQVDDQTNGAIDKDRLFETVERVRGRLATLIGAAPGDVAYTKNISDGINAVAAALDWRTGDNVIVCPDLEHPSNIYPWINLKRRQGVEVRTVAAENGHLPVERMIAAMDARTRVLATSAVSFVPGFRADLKTLGEACRARGAMFLVDGAQAIGVSHLDMRELPIDVLSVSTQKGLCAFYGMGVLYVRPDWADRLSPVSLSRFGVDLGDAHESAAEIENYRLMPDARRFEVGNYNYIATAAVEPSLTILNRIGTRVIERHTTALASDLASRLMKLGIPVIGGEPGPHRAHVVCVGRGIDPNAGHDAGDMQSLHAALTQAGVKLSIRRGLLRISFHLYNNQAEVDRVAAIAEDWKSQRAVAAE